MFENHELLFSGIKTVKSTPVRLYSRYTNAKVVLIGESGVGKTGLANRLSRDEYVQTDSTHAMNVARIEVPGARADGSEREVWLWDLAGQADYRLIHQLFLHETSVGIFVTNPQLDDPFAQLLEWSQSLKAAMNRTGHDPAKLLVAARVDRGGMRVSTEKINRFMKEEGFHGFIETSANTGLNCSDDQDPTNTSELKRQIAEAILWDRLPFISTDRLLRELKNTVMDRASGPKADAVIRFSELYQQLQRLLPEEDFTEEDARKAVRLLGNQNVILPLEFGDLILLRPGLLSSYASAIIRAARNHTDEIGSVREKDVLDGRINMDGVERLPIADEQLLLRALIQLLLERAICFAEDTEDGRQLVFPSQFRRTRPIGKYPDVVVIYTFSGNLPVIFTTLVVRLWAGKVFKNKEIWQNAVEFEVVAGATIGFAQENLGEGKARLSVFADAHVSPDTKAFFSAFIDQHLRRVALEVVRERRFRCTNPKCGRVVTDQAAIQHRIEAGKAYIPCVYCEKKVPLIDGIEQRLDDAKVVKRVQDVEQEASASLDNQAREQLLIGHMMAIAAEANQIFRPLVMFDYGIDGEVEFKDNDGKPSGRRIYVQLKSGESYLRERKKDGKLIFDVREERHLEYWISQPCDVFLVIRKGDGLIQWMNVSKYIRERAATSRQIVFDGEPLTAFALMRLQKRMNTP